MLLILIALNILIVSVLIFSINDCYLKRGPRLTFNFFFFSFLYILIWIWRYISPILFSLTPKDNLAHINVLASLGGHQNIFAFTIFIFLITIFGWMSLSYIGWFISESIQHHFAIFKKGLFLAVLLSSLVVVVILCPIVKIISIVDWQKWNVPIFPNDIFLVGHPIHPFREGFYFYMYFLAAYFLIECSKWRHRNWKMVFFILPFVHLWTIRLFGSESAIFFERFTVLTAVFILAILNRLELIDSKSWKNLR